MSLLKKLTLPHLLLILFIILGAGLRFYRLPEMAHFDFDQEFAANFAYSIIKDYPIQLIGQPLSVQGLFMGPFYFYYLVPFFYLSNLHPIGGTIGTVFLGLLAIPLYYFLLKDIFGQAAALTLAFIRSFIFTMIDGDWDMTPTHSSDIVILLTWFCFYKIWQGNFKFLPVLALVFGLYTSIHPILFPFYLVFLLLVLIRLKHFLKKKLAPSKKILVLSFILGLLPLTPLLIFEILRNFFEVKTLISFLGQTPVTTENSPHLIRYFYVVFIEPLSILKINFIKPEFLFYILLTIFLILNFKKIGFWKDSFHRICLPITFLVFLFYYNHFPLRVPEYYFRALYILIMVYTFASLSLLLKKRILVPIFLIVLVNISIANWRELTANWENNNLKNLAQKDNVVKEIIKIEKNYDREFFVSYITNLGWNTGFNYLFKYYQEIPQTKGPKDPIYTIVFPWDLSSNSIDYKSGYVGVILKEEK